MKVRKKIMGFGLLVIFTSFMLSCSNENIELKEQQYEIVSANSTEKASISSWISSTRSGRMNNRFNPDELQRIVDLKNGDQILTILNTDDKNEAISFSLDENGHVAFSFLSKTIAA